MDKLKTKVIYQGGSLPVPSYNQKGIIRLQDNVLYFEAKGKSPQYDIDATIPLANLRKAAAEERKYYSSVGYFLVIGFIDHQGDEQTLELEIRSFVRRGRAQAISRLWASRLNENAGLLPSP